MPEPSASSAASSACARAAASEQECSPAYETLFREHGRFVWGICYRMTGSAADADDLTQDAFLRALESPPRDTALPWRPWLGTVAINLARDHLRRRRRREYTGPWLPSPIETGEEASPPAVEAIVDGLGSTEGRYDLLESVSFAFLLALEALTPQQRAVLLLRDVFDYSVRETADALGISETNTKTTHHRARRAMAAYERDRCRPTRQYQDATREALGRMMMHLGAGDVAAIEAMLADDVRALSDGGGEFHAALRPIVGPVRVARLYSRLFLRRFAVGRSEVRMLNGVPAIVAELAGAPPGQASRMVQLLDLAPDGRVRGAHTVLATAKLTAIRF